DRLDLMPGGEIGELCFAGPQVTPGYWRDPERTGERYVAMPWSGEPENRWYRTGDLARLASTGVLHFPGRRGEQVKIRGYRIELQEIEAVLREAAGTDNVAVVPHPVGDSGPTGIVAFVADSERGEDQILSGLKSKLPDYMLPKEIHRIEALPLNANGKID